MPYTKDPRIATLQAARTAAGRFRAVAAGRTAASGRSADADRRRAAELAQQTRTERFAHLKALHD